MNIALMHYHLNRGGVTQVIASQLRAIELASGGKAPLRVALLSGQRAADGSSLAAAGAPLLEIARLGYDAKPIDDSTQLAQDIREQLAALGFAPEETVLHVHNHSLGKNVSLPGALRLLAEDGFALLLQIHDFVEDARPANYRRLASALGRDSLSGVLYPQAPHIHYAAINARDMGVLASAGIDGGRTHYLPNAVCVHGSSSDREAARKSLASRFGIPVDQRFLLYPVRAIRRKNIAEALLWAVLGQPHTHIGITLAPTSPDELLSYERWKRLTAELGLNVHFELGEGGGLTLSENMAAADGVLTTSVAEGFGMAFLEPWCSRRELFGRDLSEITHSYVRQGVALDNLYARLKIPVGVVGRGPFLAAISEAYSATLRAYRAAAPDFHAMVKGFAPRIQGGTVDFADLSEELQEAAVRSLHADRQAREVTLRLNPLVGSALNEGRCEPFGLAERNRAAVERGYSLEKYGAELLGACRAAIAAPRQGPVESPAHGERILAAFLTPDRFRPILGSSYVPIRS